MPTAWPSRLPRCLGVRISRPSWLLLTQSICEYSTSLDNFHLIPIGFSNEGESLFKDIKLTKWKQKSANNADVKCKNIDIALDLLHTPPAAWSLSVWVCVCVHSCDLCSTVDLSVRFMAKKGKNRGQCGGLKKETCRKTRENKTTKVQKFAWS